MHVRNALSAGLLTALVFATSVADGRAEWVISDLFHKRAEITPRHVAPQTPYQRLARAGLPHCVSPWAIPSNEAAEWGYYVGGGATFGGGPPFGGDPRYSACEGTWGWDYMPWYSRVRLRWFHGRKKQDGEGQYEPDHRNWPFFLNRPN